jgi:hypothetical protein
MKDWMTCRLFWVRALSYRYGGRVRRSPAILASVDGSPIFVRRMGAPMMTNGKSFRNNSYLTR